MPNSPFWIIVNDDASGPNLNVQDLKGVTIAVTGKIEKRDVHSHPWLVVKSTTQIQPRSALHTDHISRGYQKEGSDNVGALAEFGQAIEQQPDRRKEAYESIARIKAKQGDWDGALAAYDDLIRLDPNDSGPYWVRATAKKQHGDFESAMSDFTRAAELRSSGVNFVDIGNQRKAHGDLVGAMADYDKAIAMLDSQIAGVQKPADRLDLLFYQRGYAKELKGDIGGAVANYGQAIAIKPSYEACAFSRRGDIKKTRGDLSGAIADYQFAVKYAQLPEDKQKLEQTRAEARAGAKKVVVQPSLQAAQNEQSASKYNDEVFPESIAEAFVQAYSGTDADALANLYADPVDHTNSGVISNAAVRKQAQEYFERWPVRVWSLVGPVETTSMGPSRQKLVFSAKYDACNPQTRKHASGIAQETLIVAGYESGAMEIVSQKEQVSKRNSSRSDQERSDYPCLQAAKAEYQASSGDEAARVRYVTKLSEMDAQMTPHVMHNPDLDAKEAYANQAGAIEQELHKHPMPRNVDSRKLSQLLVGEWASPRHVYAFRADGTYGVGDEQRDKWRIDGNEYIDDVSRGPIILLDRNYFIYANGEGVIGYTRVDSASSGKGDKPSDLDIKQKLLGYWKFPKAVCYIAADGKMYVGPRKSETEASRWDVKNGKFYWDKVPYTIVTLTDNKFVFREIGGQEATLTLIRSTKEEVGPD